MQQLYPIKKAFSFFQYTGSKVLLSFLLLTPFSSFSQEVTNTTQTASANTTVNGPNLPNLIAFTVILQNQKVIFNWTTSYEENLSNFVVQRSADGKSFDDRAVIFSDGNTDSRRQYVFTDNISDLDNGLNSGQVYYRLKLVSLDGQTGYSQTLVVLFSNEGSKAKMVAYPNPAVSELRVVLPADCQNKPVSFSVYDTSGRLMMQKVDNPSSQNEALNIAALHIGMYLLRVVYGDQKMAQSFIKAN
jgi:hypothetical protein